VAFWVRVFAVCLWACAMSSDAAKAAGGIAVGVSWSNFQEERWKTDEAALRGELERAGARYLSADAQSSTEKQIADIEGLIARGARVLVVVAQDADALLPAIAMAQAEGIRVIAYDRLIALPGVVYVSFDNREVGRMQAREILARVPRGRYVFIKGAATDPNADFVHSGQLDVLAEGIANGDVIVVADQYVDGWLPEGAQRTMEQILTATDNRVDAVVCSNDGMAGGVLAALKAQGLEGLPLSGQDGDHAALARVAQGTQTVSVWKDARELGVTAARLAVALATGQPLPDLAKWSAGPGGETVDAMLLEPVAITRANLERVIDSGWVPRERVCAHVGQDPPPACTAAP